MEVHERADGVTVVNDAYNANPDSMRAALKALAAIGRGRPRRPARSPSSARCASWASRRREEHDAVGRLAVRLDIHQLLVVGEAARPIHLGRLPARARGAASRSSCADADAALDWLRAS